MSSSLDCEMELRKLADSLQREAQLLNDAADTLETLRNADARAHEIKIAKDRARSWMKDVKRRTAPKGAT